MGLDPFLLLDRRMGLAIRGGYCLQIEGTSRHVLDLVVAMVLERMAEDLGLGMGV